MQRLLALASSIFVGSLLLSAASCASSVEPCDPLVIGGDHTCGVPGWEERAFLIHLPPGFDPRAPLPVLLVLHGGAGNKEKMQALTCASGTAGEASCLDALADREGFAVVYPDGTSAPVFSGLRAWNAGGGDKGLRCVSGPACKDGVDDEAYVARLLDEVARVISIDRARVYASGFSNGAAMAQRLACSMADRIAAVAAVSGANQFAAAQGCAPTRAVPVLAIHGDADPCWAFEGGVGACLQEDGDAYIGVRTSLESWARVDGCAAAAEPQTLPDLDPADGTRVVRETWTGCRAPVELLRIEGGGHAWPGGAQYLDVDRIGRASRDLDGNARIWAFLSAHQLPR